MNDAVNEWKEEVSECEEKGEGQKEGRARAEKGAEREGKEESRRKNQWPHGLANGFQEATE